MTQLPRSAPPILVEDGTMPPKFGRGFVEECDEALLVGGVDGDWQRLQQIEGMGAREPDAAMFNRIHRPPRLSMLEN
ncbi:hypothetical protein [Mesorhizobium sp. M4B.F.Ca.ET.169.01.1.1]